MKIHFILKSIFYIFLFSFISLFLTPPVLAETSGDYDYSFNDDNTGVVISAYVGEEQSVVIPNSLGGKPVVGIGINAFRGKSFSSVVVPASVKYLEEGAFGNNSNLISVTFASSSVLETIGKDAFTGTGIISIAIPTTVTSIGVRSFYHTTGLEEIIFGNSLTDIGDYAFYQSGLTSIDLPDSLINIGEWAFYDTGLESIKIPNSVINIGEYAFNSNKSLTEVTIGDGLKEIKQYTFSDSPLLSTIDLGSGVESINAYAFSNINLTSVIIPDSVTSIASSAFYDIPNLETVIFGDGLSTIVANIFLECPNLTTVTMGSGVTTIEGVAFTNNKKLNSVTLNDGLITIDQNAFSGIDLRSIVIPGSVETIGYMAFANNPNLTNVVLENGVVSIGALAFSSTGLESIIIPDSVQSLVGASFSNNQYLTEVFIGDGLSSLDESIFSSCPNITKVTLGNNITNIGANFANNRNLTEVILGNNLVTIGDNAFTKTGLSGVVIPNSVISIGEEAFSYNNYLTSVTLGENLEEIKAEAFMASDLRSVIIPNSVTNIGSHAFFNNKNLSNVTLNNSLTEISPYLFGYTALENILIPDSVTSIGESAFQNTPLKSLIIPNNVISIGDYAFGFMTLDGPPYTISPLSNVVLGNSLKFIGSSAFSHASIENITFPESIIRVEAYAFLDNEHLESAYFLGDAPELNKGGLSNGRYFDNAHSNFSIYYSDTATGFSTPSWEGYPAAISTDINDVLNDRNSLIGEMIKGENIDLSNITRSLAVLPESGSSGSSYTWLSLNEDLVSNDGQTINRPNPNSQSATTTLQATITKDGSDGLITTKTFDLILLTQTTPTLSSSAASQLTRSGATLNASLSEDGGRTISARGFNYGLTTNYTATTTELGTIGDYSSTLTKLTCGTTYHYRAYAINEVGIAYGDDLTFETSACLASAPVSLPPAIGLADSSYSIVMGGSANVGVLSSGGTNIMAYINSRADFSVPESFNNNQIANHSLTIANLNLFTNIITITISSEPQTFCLKKGESKLVDLDGDGKYDIEVFFTDLYVNRAEVKIKIIDENEKIITKNPVISLDPDTIRDEFIAKEISLSTMTNDNLSKRLTGRILLQVENYGEAWYINPKTNKRIFLGKPQDAFRIMRELSLGITNNNLEKIPVASLLDSNSNEIVMDNTFAKKQAGKILLQVENNGEAWYVSPINNRRYFLGRPADALELMRKIGLGITNKDLRSIGVDK